MCAHTWEGKENQGLGSTALRSLEVWAHPHPAAIPGNPRETQRKGSSREHCMDTKIFSTDRYTLTRVPLQYTAPHLRQEKTSR